ncbi:MAG: hypothetical protein CM1200mP40_27540 [Gammaproteobacteria bacterium]|nr:MAG: hypothetical protein CM1200mP40_27540 [Gammaproteobacteria bacterium]
MKDLLREDYDAIFVGTGAPLGKHLDLPGYQEAKENIHTGIEWLASVAFEHIDSIGNKVIVLGGGNTAMDCCRTSKRLGGDEVTVVVRSGFDEMKASPWEIEDAMNEDIPVVNFHVPKEYILEDGKLAAKAFEKVRKEYDENGRRLLISTGEDPVVIPCNDVLCAIGQDNSFPWIERDLGIEFDKWELPVLNKTTFQSTHERVFFGGDAALGPDNIITAVAHGHDAALSIHLLCNNHDINDRPNALTALDSQKMGIHQWSYDNDISSDVRYIVPHAAKEQTLNDLNMEVELGFDEELAFGETMRCLNCDIQTVFTDNLCIECDACVDICQPTASLSLQMQRSQIYDKTCWPQPRIWLKTFMCLISYKLDGSWRRTKTSAFTVDFVQSAALQPPGTCENISSILLKRKTRARVSPFNQSKNYTQGK